MFSTGRRVVVRMMQEAFKMLEIKNLKKIYYGKYIAGLLFFLAAVTIAAFAVVSYLAIWQKVL